MLYPSGDPWWDPRKYSELETASRTPSEELMALLTPGIPLTAQVDLFFLAECWAKTGAQGGVNDGILPAFACFPFWESELMICSLLQTPVTPVLVQSSLALFFMASAIPFRT